MRKICNLLSLTLILLFLLLSSAYAQQIPSAAQEERAIRKVKPFREFEKPPKDPEVGEEAEEDEPEIEDERKLLIERIDVEGNTVVPDADIEEITAEYENMGLSLTDLNKIAEKITHLYHSRGYVTSRAYIPPQTLKDNIIKITVMEGRFGDIKIDGAVYTNEAVLKRRLAREKDKVLNYDDLIDDLFYLNRKRDRMTSAVLVRGEEPGTTDAIIRVKDAPPVHVYASYDNTGSRSTGIWRLTLGLEHTSLLGWDDGFMLRYVRSNTGNLYGWLADYTVPVNEDGTIIGVEASYLKSKAGGDFQDFAIESWSTRLSPFIEHPMFDLEYNSGRLSGRIRTGIDIIDARSEILSIKNSRDRTRAWSTAFIIEESDDIGYSVLIGEIDLSSNHFLGAMDRGDADTSRAGADANFKKYSCSFSRINKMPLSTLLFLRADGQMTNNPLLSSEQYRIGGMDTVRGYAEGDALGDYGANASAELRYPLYFIPEDWHIYGFHPRRGVQGAAFVDWGYTHFMDPTASESHNRDLLGVGIGGRVDIMSTIQGRYDIAWPIGKTASDYGRSPRAHMYVSFREPTLQEHERIKEQLMYTRINDRLNRVKADVPDEMKTLFEDAQRLEDEGNYEEAKALYAKVVNIRDRIVTEEQTKINAYIELEKETQAIFEQAERYRKQGDVAKAREMYEKVLNLSGRGEVQ